MKKAFKRIVSFLLSICIVTVSVLFYPVPVYANSSGVHPDPSKSPVNILINGVEEACWYIISQMGALADGDFFKYMQNKGTWNDYWNGDNVTEVTDDNGNVISYTFSEDLVAYIKQALQEYADETNPFFLVNTYRARDIPASTFPTKTIYNTYLAYATSHNVSAFQTYTGNSGNGYLRLGDVTPLLKEGGAFVSKSIKYCTCYTVNGDWSSERIIYDNYNFNYTTDSPKSQVITEIKEGNGYFEDFTYYIEGLKSFQSGYGSNGYLVSPDGGRIRVFKSLAEFMNYDAGQRKVYFGSGFYDFDPTDITATWDEINDKIDRMDDILQDILDAITDNPNLSEEDLEKLIDELIGKIGEIGGELGDKTDQTNTILGGISSTLGGIASSLSGYFSSVLDYLDQILEAIKALVWIEADDKLDNDKSDLLDLIDKIWKDPETGSQEAADTLSGSFAEIASGITKKFPFSIPWDIYSLFTVFSGTAPPDTATYRTVTLGVQPFTVDEEDLEQDIHEAPYFKLPLRIDSFRIYEEVVVDLKDFKPVSRLSRGLLSVLFAVFLIKFTMRIIDLFRGGTDD